jgi:hypothetical protein
MAKTYTMSGAAANAHVPGHPERTARRGCGGAMNFDMVFQVWPNRASMAKSIRMQERREYRNTDWKACVKLSDGEGY